MKKYLHLDLVKFSFEIKSDKSKNNDLKLKSEYVINKKVKKQSLFSEEDLKYQEERRKRKVRKLTFEER